MSPPCFNIYLSNLTGSCCEYIALDIMRGYKKICLTSLVIVIFRQSRLVSDMQVACAYQKAYDFNLRVASPTALNYISFSAIAMIWHFT